MIDLVQLASGNVRRHPEFNLSWTFLDDEIQMERWKEKDFYLNKRELFLKVNGINNYISALLEDDKEQFIGEKRTSEYNESQDEGKRGDFFHFNTWDEAIDTFLNKPYTLKVFRENEDKLTEKNSSGNSIEFDKTGDFIDVSRHLDGDPDCFGYMTDGNIASRYMNLIITIGGASDVSRGTLTEYAEMVQEVVDYLENNKIRCRIDAFATNQCSTSQIRIKDYDEPLSMSDLYVATNTDFFRRLHFRDVENSPTRQWGYGSGVVRPKIEALAEPDTPTLYFTKIDSGVNIKRKKVVVYREIQDMIDNWDINPTPQKTIHMA